MPSGASRGRIPSLIRRFNRAPYSYVPGQPLEDFILYFDYPAGKGHDDKFEIASAAYRRRKSRCFVQSKGGLTCRTRHDPHQSPPPPEKRAPYTFPPSAWAAINPRSAHWSPASIRMTPIVLGATCPSGERRMWSMRSSPTTLSSAKCQPAILLAELPERHLTDAEDYHGEVVPYYPFAAAADGREPSLPGGGAGRVAE